MEIDRQLSTLFVSTLVLIALVVVLTSMMPEDERRHLTGAEFLVS
jgi:hypothetical protein